MTNKPQFVGEKSGTTLKDSCVLIMGQSPSSNSYNTSGDGLPFYQGNADFGEESPVPRSWCTELKKIAEKGDILISVRAPIGAINIADEKCCIGRGVAAIRPNQEVMSPDFLQHQLFASRNKLEAMGTGSTFKAIGKKTLSDFPVVIYPKNTQEAIAQQLNLIKKQIKTVNSQLDQLDSLVKSRFVEMFGDPCDPGSSSAKSRIDSFCELRIGPFGSALHKEDYITDGHPLVNPSHIIGGAIRLDENLTIDDGKYESLAAYHLLPGDVVLGRRGEIGRCAVVKTDGLICGTGSMIIRPGQKVRSDYLQRVVSFPSFSHALEANAVGVTMKNLNAKIVGSAEVFLPDLKDQDTFISFVSQIDKSRFISMSRYRDILIKNGYRHPHLQDFNR